MNEQTNRAEAAPRNCGGCLWYSPILDVCRKGGSVRMAGASCGEWEGDGKRRYGEKVALCGGPEKARAFPSEAWAELERRAEKA